jgi:hypothetical protein
MSDLARGHVSKADDALGALAEIARLPRDLGAELDMIVCLARHGPWHRAQDLASVRRGARSLYSQPTPLPSLSSP